MSTETSAHAPYVIGAHLFGSASPVNFWDTFRLRELDRDLDTFVEDGFNTVLLVVPWAQFQHSMSPIRYGAEYFRRMDAIFEAAHRRGLRVALRMGYLWEPWPAVDPTNQRYREFFQRDEVPPAWRDFNARMYEHLKDKPAFAFAFLSWEDVYWPLLIWGGGGDEPRRIERARVLGFPEYVRRRFTLPGLKTIYNWDVPNWESLPIPTKDQPAYELYLRFYEEELLDRITAIAVEAFPGMRLEMRVDPDSIPMPGGTKFYHWSMNHWGPRSKVVYYHANIGQSADRRMDTDEALAHIERLLQTYTRNLGVGEEKVFIDQFNFFDNTFASWSRINEASVPEFLCRSASLLQKYTNGYAVWGFRDWRKDTVFNGSFELSSQGWELSGGAFLAPFDPDNEAAGRYVELPPEGAIAQPGLILKIAAAETKHVRITGEGFEDATLRIEVNERAQDVRVTAGPFERVVAFDTRPVTSVAVRAMDKRVRIFKVHVFDRVYSQGLRTVDGSPTPASNALIELNRRLVADES